MNSDITSTKVTDEVTCELVNQSTSSLNQVRKSPSEVFSEFKDNYSSDSLDKPLVQSKKYIIIPSTSTTSIDKRQSLNVSQSRKPITKNESTVSLNSTSFGSARKEKLPSSDFKPQHPQNLLKSDRFSSTSMKSNVSGIYLYIILYFVFDSN